MRDFYIRSFWLNYCYPVAEFPSTKQTVFPDKNVTTHNPVEFDAGVDAGKINWVKTGRS